MEYVYLKRQYDEKIITEYIDWFRSKTLAELVDAYNKEAKCGIVGVHRQALYLIALNDEFRERLKVSPIYLLEYVLGMVGKIELVNGHIRIKEQNEKQQ